MGQQLLQAAHVGCSTKASDSVLSPPQGGQLHIYRIKAQNTNASAVDLGLLKKLGKTSTKLYSLAAASSPNASLSDMSAPAPIFTGTANDGFLVQSKVRFNLIGIIVSGGQAGGTFTVQYYNGTSFVTLPVYEAPAAYGAGTQIIVFNAPSDWVPGTTAAVGGDSSMYAVKVISTTAPAGSVVASSLFLGQALDLVSQVPSMGFLELNFYAKQPCILSGSEVIFPYYSAASAKNSVAVSYSIQE